MSEKERKFFHALFLYSEKYSQGEKRERKKGERERKKEELYQSSLKIPAPVQGRKWEGKKREEVGR